MTLKLSDLRYAVEREVRDTIENDLMIIWCNNANMEFGTRLNIPTTATIALNTTDLKYAEPTGVKQINRLWLQSDYDNGVYREFTWPYRRYNGYLWFTVPYQEADTLNVDYYKDMTYFTDITDPIDIDDRYSPLYTFFAKMNYYRLPEVMQKMGESAARKEAEAATQAYLMMKNSILSYYSMKNPDYVVKERW